MSDRVQTFNLEEFAEEPRTAARLHRVALTCHYFESGYNLAKIKDTLEKIHGIRVSRETPYSDLLYGAKLGYLEYRRPLAQKAQERLRKALHKRFPHTDKLDLSVVQTDSREDVGAAGAVIIRNLIEDVAHHHVRSRLRLGELVSKYDSKKFHPEDGRIPVHIGFGGGRTLGALADRLGKLLQRDLDSIDAEIQDSIMELCEAKALKPSTEFFGRFQVRFVLHNLVAGFDYKNPETHPIAFMYQMVAGTPLAHGGRTEFCCFSSAPFAPETSEVTGSADPALFKHALKDSRKLDILVSSASSFEDEMSVLRRFYGLPHVEGKQRRHALEYFEEKHCRGDYFWQPIGDAGPLPAPKKAKQRKALGYRPATLIELKDLPKVIEKGAKVVLAMGPSKNPDGSLVDKADVLQAILQQKAPLATHAIVDVETARSAIKRLGRA